MTYQPTNDFIHVIARTSDPDTSKEAALEFEANQSKAQKCVKTVARMLSEKGPMTDFEIANSWMDYWGDEKWSDSLPRKARHWARQKGLVKDAGYGLHQGRRVKKWEAGADHEFADKVWNSPKNELHRAREKLKMAEQALKVAGLHLVVVAMDQIDQRSGT